ncbi:MAG: NADP-dependent oxidoreductase [Chloroflexota bacterium]|nr:NADP-dependent oxidoreductase [Chloroflexota bacterium]
MSEIPEKMRAIVIDQFGGIEEMRLRQIPVPQVEAHEILLRVQVAGVGTWDPFEREGGYADAVPVPARFPYILGSEGAGIIQKIGSRVTEFAVGDRVYAVSFLNPKGGFYAEYVAVDAQLVSRIPDHLTVEQAGVLTGGGITALRGLEDVIKLQPGERGLIFGAGGGVGHMAVQLAKSMGAHIFAVASGADGVALAAQVGADRVVDGRTVDVLSALKAFAPDGLDAALLTAGGEAAEQALAGIRPGGRIAFPNGIQPVPTEGAARQLMPYNGAPDGDIVRRFDRMVKNAKIIPHLAAIFPLEHAQDAHRMLDQHYVGRLALRVTL